MRQSLRRGVNVSVFQRKTSGPGRVWRNHNPAAKKRQFGESVPCGTTYVAVQHLLFTVETQTHKRVTSAVKVNELRVNMEIFQNVGAQNLQPRPTHRLREALISCWRTICSLSPLFVNISFTNSLNLSSFLSWLEM